MEENNKDIQLMKELIAKKHAKSASQGSVKKRPEDRFGTTSHKSRRSKKENEEAGSDEGPSPDGQ